MKIEFQSPEALYLLLLALPLLLLSLGALWQGRRLMKQYATRNLWQILTPEYSGRKHLWRDLILLLGMGLLVVALARPRIASSINSSEEDRLGIETMICVDVSNSMLSRDLSPSRIDFARQSVSKLLERRPNDKSGLIVFAAKAYVQLPITTDLKTAQQYVADIHPRMLSAQGTAIAEAIRLAKQSFSERRDIGKAIVILTDGESHDSDAVEAAQEAADLGIRIYVMGIGSTDGGPIPMGSSYLKDEEGETVITRLNSEMCRSVASAGSGAFIHASSLEEAQEALSAELDKLPKAALEQVQGSGYIEKYELWVWVALMLLLAEQLISRRKNRFLSKHNIFGNER
ncbi:VWA domain-containing protein [Porphyromonas sp. COT-239 OH1446]|uniref:VWA domain-containing protein n=1 Tax=Porphyromonas sp. COT-239 OH1446 TaxID=1515613 RepID=UPI00052BC937|nr:VWA domain-containing protein [Porphyromonas sp. COT-239 OH1446]KGN70052.1 aerotolerance regulator BatB [Porphyromonas sp. COT-239 OH1446]